SCVDKERLDLRPPMIALGSHDVQIALEAILGRARAGRTGDAGNAAMTKPGEVIHRNTRARAVIRCDTWMIGPEAVDRDEREPLGRLVGVRAVAGNDDDSVALAAGQLSQPIRLLGGVVE